MSFLEGRLSPWYDMVDLLVSQQKVAEALTFAEQSKSRVLLDALQSGRTAKTLRWQDGKVIVTDGPFAETKEVLGGFFVFEARDVDHAVELMSKHPGVRMGPFEIRPADEQANAMVAERRQRKADKSNR